MADSVTLAKLLVELGVDPSEFMGGMKQVQAQTKETNSVLQGIGQGVGQALYAQLQKLGSAIPNFLEGAVKGVLEFTGNLDDLSGRTGIAYSELQSLGYAGSLVGVGMESIAGSVQKMQRALSSGSAATAESLKKIGLSIKDLSGKSAGEQLSMVVTSIAKLESAATRTAVAMQLLGRSGAQLIPLGSGLKEAMDRAHELGIVLDDVAVRAGDALGDKVTTLEAAFTGFRNQLGSVITMSPALHTAIDGITNLFGQLSTWVYKNRDALTSLVSDGLVMVARGVAMAIDAFGTLIDATASVAVSFYQGSEAGLRYAGMLAEIAGMAAKKVGLDSLASSLQAQANRFQQLAATASATGRTISESTKMFTAPIHAAADSVDKLANDMEKAAASGLKLGDGGKKMGSDIEDGAKRGEEAIKRLAEAHKEFNQLSNETLAKQTEDSFGKGIMGDLARIDNSTQQTIMKFVMLGLAAGESEEEIQKNVERITEMGEAAKDAAGVDFFKGAKAKDLFHPLQQGVEQVKKSTVDWHAALQDVANAFQVLGISSDSTLGRIMGGLSSAANAAQGLQKALTDSAGKFSLGNFSKLDFLGKVGAVGQAIQFGASIFNTLKGIFGKPEWKTIGENAGRVLGMAVSEQLAKQIQSTMKSLHVDVNTAALLNLSSAISESGKSATTFLPQMQQLVSGIAAGTIPAAQGVEEIGKAFDDLQKEAEAGSASAQAAMTRLIQQARAAGVKVPEMAAAVAAGLQKAVEGLGDFTKSFHIASPEDAKAEAYIFSATFWAEVQENGLVAAGKALLPAWEAMQQQLAASGIDPAVVEKIIGPIGGVMAALGNASISGVITALDGASRAVKGLADAGYLTQGAFQGLEQVAVSSVQQIAAELESNGVPQAEAQAQALQMAAPQLAQLKQLSEQYGIALDDTTTKLLAQAAASGVAFPTDPLQQVVSLLKDIAVALGAIPKEIDTTVNVHTNFGDAGNVHGGPFGNLGDVPKFAGGGTVYAPTLAWVGERGPEDIVPHGEREAYAAKHGAGGGSTTVNFAPGAIMLNIPQGMDPRAVGEAVVEAIRNNYGGVRTEMQQGL